MVELSVISTLRGNPLGEKVNKQLLIYGNVVPVSSKTHLDLSVKTGVNYEFSRTVNSVPLTAVEFQSASSEYPIVFAGTDKKILPVAVLGIQAQHNAFLNASGEMEATYIPAFLRRYPFVFSSKDDGDNFTLCIDEGFEGCNREGRGEKLFDSEGEKTQYLTGVLEFLKQYQAHFSRTEAFCRRLTELNLLEPMGAQITPVNGKQINLSGFHAINRERLKALPESTLAELVKSDEMELIYVHLQSLRKFSDIGNRGMPESQVQPGVDATVEDEAEKVSTH